MGRVMRVWTPFAKAPLYEKHSRGGECFHAWCFLIFVSIVRGYPASVTGDHVDYTDRMVHAKGNAGRLEHCSSGEKSSLN